MIRPRREDILKLKQVLKEKYPNVEKTGGFETTGGLFADTDSMYSTDGPSRYQQIPVTAFISNKRIIIGIRLYHFYRMWAILFWISVINANLLDPSKKGKKDSNKLVNVEKTIER